MSTVAFFPSLHDLHDNPYWQLLGEGLEAQGVHVLDNNPRWLSLRWLSANRHRVQVLHIHYFQANYAYMGTRARLPWVVRFARNLAMARLLGYRVVWTVHNESPSFPLQPKWVEDFAHLLLARLASAVIVHCDYARRLIAQRYGRRRSVYVAPHPNFIGVYGGNMDRFESREWLGLPMDATVILCFGQLRPNKGIEVLLSAFVAMPDQRLRLVIAGDPAPDAAYVEILRQLAVCDERILFRPERVPEDQVQLYYAAADLVVAPFARVLTSGSVLLALSLRKPVIVPAAGCLPEVVVRGSGWLYNPSSADGLLSVLRSALSDDLKNASEAAASVAQNLPWSSFVRSHLLAYGMA